MKLVHSEHSYDICSFVSEKENRAKQEWWKKINQTGIIVKNLYKSLCKRNCDRSSSRRSPVITVMMYWVESHNSRVLGTLPPQEIFMFLWIRLSIIHKTHFLSSLFFKFHVKKTCVFSPAITWPNLPEHFTFTFHTFTHEKI